MAVFVLAPCGTAQAQLYWDTNNATTGFGTAGGTWAAPTTNNATQGWSSNATGVTALSGTTTTTTSNALIFGTSANQLATGTITVSGAVSANSLTFAGSSSNITLSGGNITLGGTTPNITVTNTANTSATTQTISSNITLGANQIWTVTSCGTLGTAALTASGQISGGFGISKNGTGTLTLTGANTYTGATSVEGSTLFVNGAAGSINASSGITIAIATTNGPSWARLELDNTAGNVNRIGDTSMVTLHRLGELALIGNTSTSTTETIGGLTIGSGIRSSVGTITLNGTSGSVLTTLAAGNFTRVNKSTALIRGTNLGNGTTNATRLTLTDISGLTFVGNTTANGATPGTAKDLKIVPYLFGDTSATGTGSSFVTYDTTGGLRPLAATEYTTLTAVYTAPASRENVIAFNGAITAANPTVNSLLFNTASQTLNGTGALTVQSGAIAAVANTVAIGSGFSSVTLGDGTWNEGILTATSGNTLTINAPIAVTGGANGTLTKTGAGSVILNGGSSYDAVTNVTQGELIVRHNNALGSTVGRTEVNGQSGGYITFQNSVTVADSLTILDNRPVNGSTLQSNSGQNRLTGAITFPGAVRWNVTGSSLIVTGGVTGTNTYFVLNGDAAGTYVFNNGSLNLGNTGTFYHDGNSNAILAVSGNTWGNTDIQGSATAGHTLRTDVANALPSTIVTIGGANKTATLNLNGNNQSITALAGSSVTTGIRTLISANAANLAFIGNNASSNYAGTITGALGLTVNKTAGTQTLSGNNTHTGDTLTVNGTLALGSVNALQGSTLDTGTSGAQTVTFTVAGTNTYNLGGLKGADALAIGDNSISVGANNQSTSFTGVIGTGAGGLIKVGTGALTLGGANSYTGATTVNSGSLILDYTASNTSKLSDSASLTLGSATLQLDRASSASGNHTEIVASTTLNGGANITRGTGSTAVLQMNGITRNAGATLNLGAASIANTDTTNTNGILGPWATINGSDWAMNSTNAADGPITAYTAYTDVQRLTPGTIANGSTANVRLIEGSGSAGNIALGATTTTINTLSQSTSGGTSAATIDAAGKTLAVNGILVGSGAGALTIGTSAGSGTLQSATSGGELVIHHYGSNNLTINSVVGNNTSASGLTQSGTGTTVLAGTNTYTGKTIINGGKISIAAETGLGANPGSSTADQLTLNGGTLLTTATLTIDDANRGITLGAAGGTFEVSTGTTTINSTSVIAGSGGLTKTGAGTLTLAGSANTYTGPTTISAGTLSVSSLGNGSANSALGAATRSNTNLIFDGGTLQYTGTSANGTSDRFFTINSGKTATIDVQAATVNYTTTLTLGGGAGATTGGLTKIGNGTLTITGGSDYTGDTTVSEGVLIIGANRGLGATSGNTTVASGASLHLQGSITVGENITINGGGPNISNGLRGGLNGYSGANTLTGLLTIGGASTRIRAEAGSLTISGGVSRPGGIASDVFTVVSNAPVGAGFVSFDTNPINIGAAELRFAGGETRIAVAGNTYGMLNVAFTSFGRLDVANALNASSILQIGDSGGGSGANGTLDLFGNSQTVAGLRTGSGSIGVAGTRSIGSVAAATLTVNQSTNSTYDGTLTGALALTKNGTGTLTLSGNSTNTGATTVAGGTLLLSGNGTLGTSTISISGGTLDMGGKSLTNAFGSLTAGTLSNGTLTNNGSNFALQNGTVSAVLAGTNGLTKTTSGTVTLSGANTYNGTTTISDGTLVFQNKATRTGGSSVTATAAGTVGLGVGGGGVTDYSDADVASLFNSTLSGFTLNAASGVAIDTTAGNFNQSTALTAARALTKLGSNTLTLSGANTYTGATTINAGTLAISGGAAIADTGTVTLANTSGVDFNVNSSESIGSLQGGGATGGNVTIASGQVLTVAEANSNTFSGSLQGSGSFTKSGLGTLTLNGTNTHTGATTINAGTLAISGGAAIADGSTVTLANTSGVAFNVNSSETIGSLQGGGATGGNVTIASGQTLTVAEANTNTFGGSLQGAGNLTKTGFGTLTLNGTNTNSGAISVTGGTVLLSGANALSSSTSLLSAASSTTISLADGVGSTITLSTGNLSLSSATMVFELGSTSDRLTLTSGAVTLSGTNTISLANLGSFTVGNYTLISAASGLNSGGTWSLNSAGGPTGFTFSLTSNATTLTLIAAASLNNFYWTGNASANWSGNNFSDTDGGASDLSAGNFSATSDLIFAAAGATNLSTAMDSNYTVNSLAITSPGVSIGGANTLTVNSTTSSAIAVSATSGNTTISANLAGASAGLTKTNSGTLILSGNNTYAGTTTVSGGVLNIQNANALGSTANGTTVATGAALQLQGGITVGAEALTLSGIGVSADGALRNISGNNNYGGAITLATTTRINSEAGLLTLSGGISGAQDLTIGGAGNTAISNTLATSTGTLTKDGAGMLMLSGNNTYTGATTISAGTLEIASAGRLGGGSYAGNIVNDGTFLYSSTNNQTLSGIISGSGALTQNNSSSTLTLTGNNTYSGVTTINAGTLQVASTGQLGGSNYGGNIVNNGTFTYNGSNSQTLSGVISGSGALTKNNTSTLTLTGANSYDGTTTINEGVLNIQHNNALGTAAGGTIVANGTALQLQNNITVTGEELTLAGGGISNAGGSLRSISGNNTWAGNITIGLTSTRIASDAGLLTISGGISAASGNSTLFQGNGNITVSGIISGAGSVTTSALLGATSVLTLSGNNTYTGITSLNNGILEIGATGRLGGGTYAQAITNNATFIYSGTNNQTLSGVISGTGALRQNNSSSTLTLTGNNTYTGTTTINAGTLEIGSTGRLGGGTYAQNISNNGTFIYSGTNNQTLSGVVSGTGALTQNNSSSTLTLTGNNTYTGATTINAGTLQIDSTGQLGGGSYSGNIVNNGTFIYAGNNSQTLSGIISGSGALTKNLSATLSTITLSGNNTYTGLTTIRNGTIAISHANALGATGADNGTTINAGGALELSNNITIAETITLNSTGISNAGGIRNTSGNNTISGAITSGASSRIASSGGNLTLTGGYTSSGLALALGAPAANTSITVTGNAINLGAGGFTAYGASSGSNAIVLGVAGNTFGSVDINYAGTLRTDVANAWNPNAALRLGSDESSARTNTFDLNGNSQTVASLSSSLDVASGGNITNTITSASAATLTVNGSANTTYNGTITGAISLVKAGSSTQTLGGNNTYTGATTINAGTINLTGSNTGSATAINTGGTLIGTGSAGAVTINTGGTIGAGNGASASGNLTIGSLTLNGGSTYSWDLGNAGGTAGSGWDLLTISGALTLNASAGNQITIALNGAAAPSATQSFNIINYGSLANTWDSTAFDITNNIAGSSGTWSLTNNGTFIGLTYTASAISTWSGASGSWSSNFTSIPGNNAALVFAGAGGTATNDIASGSLSSLTTITINSTAGPYTLAANSGSSGFDAATPLSITGITNNSANATTVNLALAVDSSSLAINAAAGNITLGNAISNNNTINFTGANSTIVNGAISGTGALAKAGSGTLTLSGSSANTYNGTTTVSAGTLTLDKTSGVVAVGGDLVLNGSSKLLYGASKNEQIANTASITLNGSQSVFNGSTWNSTDGRQDSITETIGSLTVRDGQFNTGTGGNWTVTGAGVFDGSSGDARFVGFSGSSISFNSLSLTAMTGTTIVSSPDGFVMGGSNATVTTLSVGSGGLTLNGSTLGLNKGSSGQAGSRLILNGNITTTGSSGSSIASNTGTVGISDILLSSTVGSVNRTITTGSGANLTISVPITNGSATTAGIIKDGLGTLTLSGSNSTYTGATTVNQGTLTLNGTTVYNNTTANSSALTIATGATVVITNPTAGLITANFGSLAGNGTLQIGPSQDNRITVGYNNSNTTFSGFVNSNRANNFLNKLGTGALTLSGNNTGSVGQLKITTNNTAANEIVFGHAAAPGSMTLGFDTAGTFSASVAGVDVKGGVSFVNSGGNFGSATNTNDILVSGAVDLGASTRTITVLNTTTFSGVVSANTTTNPGFIKDGAGTLVLSGINTYNGTTTVNGGTLTLSGGAAIANAGTVVLANTAGVVLNVNTSETIGSLQGGGATGGNVTIASGQTLNVAEANTNTFSGSIQGGGGFTKSGAGTLTLSGNNTYTGGTTITNGNLTMGANNALGNGALTFNATATARLWLNGTNQTVTGLTVLGSQLGIIQNEGSSSSSIGTITFNLADGVTSSSASNFFVRDSTVTDGVKGKVALVKTGNGTLDFSTFNGGYSGYSGGLTVNGGTFSYNSTAVAGALGSGNITLGGGTLNYTGSTAQSITNNITLTAATSSTLNNANSTITVSGTIGGTGNLIKSGAGTLTLSAANTYNGTTTVSQGTLSTDAANRIWDSSAITVASGATFLLGGNETVGSIAGAGNYSIAGFTLTVGGDNTSTAVSGNITGASGALTKIGAGTLTLSGANTYTGNTTVTLGTLALGANNVISDSSNLIINGGTFDISTYSDTVGVITMTNGSLIGTSGVLTGSAYNITGGTVTAQLGGGTLIIGNGTTDVGAIGSNVGLSVIGSSAVANLTANVSALSVSLDNGGSITGSFSLNQTGGVTANSGAIASNLIGTGGVTMNGVGNTLTISGNNTYTGATTISAGNISISTVAAVAGTSGINLANATALIYTGSAATLDRDISVTGTTGSTGTIRNESAGLLTLSGTLSKNGTTLALEGGSGGITVSGSIVGSNANSDLDVNSGVVTLTAVNTYNGPTTIKNGATLNANITGALPIANGRSDVLIDPIGSGSSTLALGASQSIASLSGAASSNVTLGSNTLTIGTTSGSTTYAGRITGGNASALVKDGASTQVLTGNNTGFTGTTTINSGTLQAASVNALGSNNTVQVNGGTLLVSVDDAINGMTVTLNSTSTTVAALSFNSNYNGTIQKLTLSANSIIDLGPANSIALAFADLAMGLYNLSIYNWSGTTKWGTTYGTGTDTIFFGAGNYTASNVKFYSGAVGSDSFVGSGFEVMPQTTWEGGFTGHYILPVPEPETWATGILLLLGGAWWMIKRTRKAA